MIAVNLDIPQADIDALQAAFARYVAYYKRNVPKTVEKTCVQLVKSLRGSTRKSKDVRRVVRNPDRYNATDRQSERFLRIHGHIQDWYRDNPGTRATGRHIANLPRLAAIKARKRSDKWAVEKYTQRRGIVHVPIYMADQNASAESAKLVAWIKGISKISRQGLAKASWGWMLSKLGKSGSAEQPEIPGATDVLRMVQGGEGGLAISMRNRLGYIRRALRDNVSTLFSRTVSQMRYDMKEITREARKDAGLKAA